MSLGQHQSMSTRWIHRRVRPAPHVLATVRADETVLFDPERQQYYTLDTVGSRIWMLIAAGASMPELIDRIGNEYELPQPDGKEIVARDIAALLDALGAARLIEVVQ